jgi:S-methylmethionine-dependent homocysteine/selenocysteine methylase
MTDAPELLMPEGRAALLDGGMGRELRNRGVPIPNSIWSANALLVAKDTVLQIHKDYIAAGADIITTNTYGIIRSDLKKEGIEDKFVELNRLAGKLAIAASRSDEEGGVAVAASLPPLGGSYRPDLVGKFEELVPLYREQAEVLEPYCDLFLCETMSSGEEARAAATAACEFGKPVWISFTLHEDKSGKLRSGETIAAAAAKLNGLPVSGILANCSAPESIDAAMPELVKLGKVAGGYANTFQDVPKDWTLDGKKATDGLLKTRDDLDPEQYAAHAQKWLAAGAKVIGGCCGTGPAHIARLKKLIESKS